MKSIIFLALLVSQSALADPGFVAAVDDYKATGVSILKHIEHLRNNAERCAPMTGSNFIEPANQTIDNVKGDLEWTESFKNRTLVMFGVPMDAGGANVCNGSFNAMISGIEAKRLKITAARSEFRQRIAGKIRVAGGYLKQNEGKIRWLFSDCPSELRRVDQAIQDFNKLQTKVLSVEGSLAAKEGELAQYIATLRSQQQSGCLATR